MLQFDLTATRFVEVYPGDFPNDAEMFVITAALLLLNDASYADMSNREFHVAGNDIEALAECIEFRLAPLARDFGDPETLRSRLREFVGLRITIFPSSATRRPRRSM